MFKIFKPMISLFVDNKKEALAEQVAGMYAPYTKRMLASNLPLKFTNNLDEMTGGHLACSPTTGQAKFMNIRKGAITSYDTLSSIEHESVHYDQAVNSTNFNMALFFQHQDSLKISRIKEMEAYGRQHYKLVVDAVQGNISQEELAQQISHPLFEHMLAAYTRKLKINNIAAELEKIKQQENIKQPEEVLPEFYYYTSQYRSIWSMVSSGPLERQITQMNIFLHSQSPIGIRAIEQRKHEAGVDKLYQKEFTFEDAKSLLGRDGNDYLGVLNKPCQEDVWRNICYLQPDQKNQTEWLQSQTAKLSF